MAISLDCPQCQARFLLPDNYAGRQLQCQKCSRVFEAPAAPQLAPPLTPRTDAILEAEVIDDNAPPMPPTAMAHAIQSSGRPVPSAGANTGEGRGENRGEGRGDRFGDPRRRRDEPDDLDARDGPRRGRRIYRQRDESSVALWVAGGIGLGVIFLVLIAVAAWLMLRPARVALAPAPPPMPPRIAVKQAPPPPIMFPGMMQPQFGGGPPAIVGNDQALKINLTKGVYQETHRLEPTDPVDPGRRQFCKVFLVHFEQGKNYVIDHIPAKENFFDAYLRLEKNPGQQLAADDDGGDGLNSRIHFNCNETGDYRVIATSLGGGLGAFTITVRDQTIPEPPRPLANIPLPQPDAVPQQLKVTDGFIGKLPAKTAQIGPAGNVCVAPDGQSFYVLNGVGLLRQVATRDLTDLKRIPLGNGCRSFALSAAGLAVAATTPGEVWVLDPATLSIKHRVSVPGVQEIVSGPATNWGYALSNKFEPGNQRNIVVLDLAKGASVHRQSLPRFGALAVADAQTAFTVGEVIDNDCLVRHRIEPDGMLARVEASPRLGRPQHGVGIVLSRDGKYVCLPSLGGNAPIGGNQQQATHVFETKNLLQPLFTMPTGPFARGVGLDSEASFAYVATAQIPLSVYDFKGVKLADHGGAGEQPQQIAVLALRKVLLRYMQRVTVVELAEDGRQVGAVPKLRPRTVDTVVRIEEKLTPEDPLDDKRKTPYKEYAFQFDANTTYTIDHEAQGFDAYLYLHDDNGVLLHQDDDGGAGFNSRIVFNGSAAGVYRVRASALVPGYGSFVLTVRKGT